MKYIGKAHNLWHRMALELEQTAFDTNSLNPRPSNQAACYEFEGDQNQKSVSFSIV